MAIIILFNKPYGVLTQFRAADKPTLADYFSNQSLRAIGRLDADSEGLLLLTDMPALVHAINCPNAHKVKTYWAQVEGAPSAKAVAMLSRAVLLNDGMTRPAVVSAHDAPDFELWPRNPPIRTRRHIPTHWLKIQICEGKNRQVRRMCAAVGLPCLRLIRTQVADYGVAGIEVGRFVRVHLNQARLDALLTLKN